jgi:hypothetical protein
MLLAQLLRMSNKFYHSCLEIINKSFKFMTLCLHHETLHADVTSRQLILHEGTLSYSRGNVLASDRQYLAEYNPFRTSLMQEERLELQDE